MVGSGLSFDCFKDADEGLVSGESFTRVPVAYATVILSSCDMGIGLMVGRDVLVVAFLLGCL